MADETTIDDGACHAADVSNGGLDHAPCTNDALRRATRQLAVLYDEVFAPIGLKATQLALMVRVERLGGEEGPTLQAVAADMSVGVSALTHALRPLLRDGLAELRPDGRDKRSKRAVLTVLGRQRLQEGVRLWAEANRRVETLLGAADAERLRALAERVSSDAFLWAFKSGLGGAAPPGPADMAPDGRSRPDAPAEGLGRDRTARAAP